jgi:dodecin
MRFEVMTAALMTAEQGFPGVPGAARLDTGKPAFWHHRHAAVAIGRLGPSARPGVARGEEEHEERWSPRDARRAPAQVPWLASCQEEDVMSAYKVIEVIGASGNSWEDAAAEAIRAAGATLHDLRVAEVVKQDIHLEEGGAITYRTKLELSFKYEHGQ